jgi:hypothetical protein
MGTECQGVLPANTGGWHRFGTQVGTHLAPQRQATFGTCELLSLLCFDICWSYAAASEIVRSAAPLGPDPTHLGTRRPRFEVLFEAVAGASKAGSLSKANFPEPAA